MGGRSEVLHLANLQMWQRLQNLRHHLLPSQGAHYQETGLEIEEQKNLNQTLQYGLQVSQVASVPLYQSPIRNLK